MRKLRLSTTFNLTTLQSVLYFHFISSINKKVEMHALLKEKRRKGKIKELSCCELSLCPLGTDFISISVKFLKQDWQRRLQWWIMLLQKDRVPFLGGLVGWWKEEEFLSGELGGWRGTTHTTKKTQTNHQKNENEPQLMRVGPASRNKSNWEKWGQGGPIKVILTTFSSSAMDCFINRFLLPNTSSS